MPALTRDRVRLWYADTGAGDPAFLFVHGWCCDHTYFQLQIDHFAASHRVVAVDLRGHGESDKPDEQYSVPGFADDILWLARELHLGKAVLVGHSLGGIVALEASATHPDAVAAAILVDPSPVIRPPGLDELARPFIDALRTPAYAHAARQHVEEVLFAPTDDPVVRARVADAICAAPQHVMASAMEAIFAWDGEAAARACTVPVLNISAANPIGDVAAFKALCPTLVTGQTVGSGHFNQLLVPEQVNSMIERFLELNGLVQNVEGPALAGPSKADSAFAST